MRILHLSDFHFSEGRAWDQDPVLRGLVKNVEGFVKTGLAPDLVAVTGDIADRGLRAEYAIAEQWFRERLLPATGITGDRLLFVPGNHDVDRGAVKKVALATQDSLLRDQDQETIAAVLGDPEEREPLLRRHAAWIAFANRFRADPIDVPWWSAVVDIRGLKLHVAGFCSSWMSCSDQDKGRLLLGRWQVHTLLAGADEAALSVALMHHPWDYLADFDAEVVREAIQRRCAIVLSGHRHRQGGQAASRPGGGVLELAAGCCYGGSDYSNAYQLLEIDPAAGRVRVHLRKWDEHDWIADRNAYGGAAPEGVAEFALPGARGAACVPSVPRPEAPGSVSVSTAGGAYVRGSVNTGRDFVGRDRIEINLGAAPQDPPELLLAAYYRSLADECRRLPLGVIDTQFVRTANEASIPLPDIYVDLDVVAPRPPRATKGNAPGPSAFCGRKGRRASRSSPPWPSPKAPAPCCSGMPARANRRS